MEKPISECEVGYDHCYCQGPVCCYCEEELKYNERAEDTECIRQVAVDEGAIKNE